MIAKESLSLRFIVRRVQCPQLRRITDAAAVSAFTTITSIQRQFEAWQISTTISSLLNFTNSHNLKCYETKACNQPTDTQKLCDFRLRLASELDTNTTYTGKMCIKALPGIHTECSVPTQA